MLEQAIGEAFYTELGEAAPEMIQLFARPKNIQARAGYVGGGGGGGTADEK